MLLSEANRKALEVLVDPDSYIFHVSYEVWSNRNLCTEHNVVARHLLCDADCRHGNRWAFYDVKEAWEALASAGVIPFDWVDSPVRRFASLRPNEHFPRTKPRLSCRLCRSVGTVQAEGGARYCACMGEQDDLPYPPTMTDLLEFVTDIPNVLQAEEELRHVEKHEAGTSMPHITWLFGYDFDRRIPLTLRVLQSRHIATTFNSRLMFKPYGVELRR